MYYHLWRVFFTKGYLRVSQKKCPDLKYSLIFPLEDNNPKEWNSNYTTMLYPKPLKTSELYVPEKKELENLEKPYTIKDLNSTELLLISWPKEEISLPEMELEENQSTELNSQTKTSRSNIPNLVSYPWLMPVLTLTDLNSS